MNEKIFGIVDYLSPTPIVTAPKNLAMNGENKKFLQLPEIDNWKIMKKKNSQEGKLIGIENHRKMNSKQGIQEDNLKRKQEAGITGI